MKKETYSAARERLMAELAGRGWHVQRLSPSMKPMVRPWARPSANGASGLGERLSFHAQAVYVGEHSLHLDIRGLSVDDLIDSYKRAI